MCSIENYWYTCSLEITDVVPVVCSWTNSLVFSSSGVFPEFASLYFGRGLFPSWQYPQLTQKLNYPQKILFENNASRVFMVMYQFSFWSTYFDFTKFLIVSLNWVGKTSKWPANNVIGTHHGRLVFILAHNNPTAESVLHSSWHCSIVHCEDDLNISSISWNCQPK